MSRLGSMWLALTKELELKVAHCGGELCNAMPQLCQMREESATERKHHVGRALATMLSS